MNRLFLPVSADPFDWYKNLNKKWEIRLYGRSYTEKNIQINKAVEIRKGYKGESLWGKIEEIKIFQNVFEMFSNIHFKEIIPVADNINTANEVLIHFIKTEKSNKIICFKIKLDED